MIVKMKRYEQLAIEYAKKYKAWELQIAAKDAYLEAHRQATIAATNHIDNDCGLGCEFCGDTKEVEVTFEPGQHQLMDELRNK